jgi:hypothetical protein
MELTPEDAAPAAVVSNANYYARMNRNGKIKREIQRPAFQQRVSFLFSSPKLRATGKKLASI